MRLVLVLCLATLLSCSSEEKTHLKSNKKLEASLQQREAKTLEEVIEEDAVQTKRIQLNESSPLVLWNNKKSPYQVMEFVVKSKHKSLIVHSSYHKETLVTKRAVIPVIVLYQGKDHQILKRTSVGDNPYCGEYRCLEAVYDIRKVPAGTYKAVVLAPILEGEDAEYNYNNAPGPQVHHTYFGELEFKFSDK